MTLLNLSPEIMWLLAGVFILILEALVSGFIFIFFGVSACIIGVFLFFLSIPVHIQLVLFMVFSILGFKMFRKKLTKPQGPPKKTVVETDGAFLGKKGVVVTPVGPDLLGKVDLFGTLWDAISIHDCPKGRVVTVVGKDNLTLEVE